MSAFFDHCREILDRPEEKIDAFSAALGNNLLLYNLANLQKDLPDDRR